MASNNKKQLRRGAWSAPSILSVLALPGCAMLIGEPVMYADLKNYNIKLPTMGPDFEGDSRHVRVPQTGEIVPLVALSDGVDALELTCEGPDDWRIPEHERTASALSPSAWANIEEHLHREALFVARERCRRKAVRVCRLQMWDGNSTFALLAEYEYFGPINDSDETWGVRMYARCMTPNTYKQWARTVDKSQVYPYVLKEWEKQLRDGVAR